MLDLFHKSNISSKLNAFLVLPLVTLLFFSGVAIFDKYQQLKRTQEAVQFSEVVQHYTVLIYNLQEERGLSAGVLSAKNNDYQLRLAKQRKITTDAYSKIAHVFTNTPPYLPKKTISNLQLIGQKFKLLNFIRIDIDNRIDNKFFDFYSLLISELLQEVNVLHAMATSQETNYMVSSLIYALGLEEYAAIERGLLHGMLNVQRSSNEYIENSMLLSVVNHVARQQAELSRYYNVASSKHSALMYEAINNKKIQKFHQYRELTVKTTCLCTWLRSISQAYELLLNLTTC